MQKIDTAEVLLEDMRDLLSIQFYEAISQIEAAPYSKALKRKYEKLSEDGKNDYWAHSLNIDLVPEYDRPWL